MKHKRRAAWGFIAFAIFASAFFCSVEQGYGQEESSPTEVADTQEPAQEPTQEPAQEPTLDSENEAMDSLPEVTDVTFVNESCDEELLQNATVLQQSMTELVDGWYVVNESLEMDKTLVVEGEVRLVLANGCILVAPKGVQVKKDSRLIVYGQSGAAGTLIVHKGIHRLLTPEQQQEEDEFNAREAELAAAQGKEYVAPDPELVAVYPCLQVASASKIPGYDEGADDPKNQPKLLEHPTLNVKLLNKRYLEITPLANHVMREHKEGDNHYECDHCGAWFEDELGHVRLDKTEEDTAKTDASEGSMSPQEEDDVEESYQSEEVLNTASETITITFDANGGSGTMEPLQVNAGEQFQLPECTFTPPEGMVFSKWSGGEVGSFVAANISLTLKAIWEEATEDNTAEENIESADEETEDASDSDSSESSSSDEASSSEGYGSMSKQDSSNSEKDASADSANSDGSPTTGDTSDVFGTAAFIFLLAGGALTLVGKKLRK